jgi:hypothetical protein
MRMKYILARIYMYYNLQRIPFCKRLRNYSWHCCAEVYQISDDVSKRLLRMLPYGMWRFIFLWTEGVFKRMVSAYETTRRHFSHNHNLLLATVRRPNLRWQHCRTGNVVLYTGNPYCQSSKVWWATSRRKRQEARINMWRQTGRGYLDGWKTEDKLTACKQKSILENL